MKATEMNSGLARTLGFTDALALVVGTVIGTGVFLKSATMAQLLGSGTLVMAAWVVAGVLSLVGALTYAELGSRYPNAGGEYVYLREGYGSFFAFLYGWMRFWIASPGSIAAYAAGAASFISVVLPLERVPGGAAGFAIATILFFSAINAVSVAVGGRTQSFLTALKILLLLFVIVACGWVALHRVATVDVAANVGAGGVSSFGAAVLAALWAYDGWNNLPMAAGEVRDPKRNLPLSLILGTFVVIAIYLAANGGYFSALSVEEVATSYSTKFQQAPSVAARAVAPVLGTAAIAVLSLGFVTSALGAMNGSILTSARVPYAMALDGMFFRILGTVSRRGQVPVWSIAVQGLISCALVLWGTFDQLTDYVVFASWIFYGMNAGALFLFRAREKKGAMADTEASYRVPGFPWVPLLFLVATVLLLANTVVTAPRESLTGLGLILLGVPVYWFFRRSARG